VGTLRKKEIRFTKSMKMPDNSLLSVTVGNGIESDEMTEEEIYEEVMRCNVLDEKRLRKADKGFRLVFKTIKRQIKNTLKILKAEES
jgi:hypothetical protein